MPRKNPDLHGNVPDSAGTAIVLIDVINDMSFPGSDRLVANALPAAKCIASLRDRARQKGLPVIYANDNFGRWRSDFREVIEHCLYDDVPGRPIAELLRPADEDYFVLKPKHSAFFATALDLLLEYLQVRRLVLAGFSGDACVYFTAHDAYMRDFDLAVPRDCTASISPDDNEHALDFMRRKLKADLTPASDIRLDAV